MRRWDDRRTALGLACVGLLLAAAPALAQRSSSFGSSGGFNGTSVGGSGSSGLASTGGGSGNNFLGMNSGTSGGSALGTNNFLGSSSGTGTNTGRGGTTQIGSTSFLGTTYGNPIAMGIGSATGTATTTNTTFGNPIYNLNSSTGRSGGGSASVSTSGQQTSNAGYNVRRLPGYATTIKIKDMPPPPTAGAVQGELQAMLNQTLAQSSDLDRRDSIQVVMDGPTVVLKGRVADDDERVLVDNMVKLTQGVGQVRNELTTMAATTASRNP
ncbi:MAG TPA: BON domain-containing protein [Gemmataceae bacterium]|nr:BON domain-containing protein [Gemmataceae bacterium]